MGTEMLVQGVLKVQLFLKPLEEEADFVPCERMRLLGVVMLQCLPAVDLSGSGWCGNGRIPANRRAILAAFFAKAVWNLETTAALIQTLRTDRQLRMLCGWQNGPAEIPSASTFSRAFAAFARNDVLRALHERLVDGFYANKLVGHLSVDSAAVEVRERVRRGTGPAEHPAVKRLELQPRRGAAENFADLPQACGCGCKRNTHGNALYWHGVKLHAAVGDGGVPIRVFLSSAALHDSQALVPLVQSSLSRLQACYLLADAAYDAQAIRAFARSRGLVALIDANKRTSETVVPFSPAERRRYAERSEVERFFGHLAHHGRGTVFVRGARKVMTHLYFGVIVIAIEQMLRMIC